MIIDVYQDTVCPWCRIGKANLLRALKSWEGADTVTIRWHAYLLDPTTPPEGREFKQNMIDKMGGPDRLKQILGQVTQAGAASGPDAPRGRRPGWGRRSVSRTRR